MENTQFHKVDMKKPTPETSLFYHTNCLWWSIVPLRVPLQNIYLSTFSTLLEIRADRPLSSFWSLQHLYCMSSLPRSPWAPHVSISSTCTAADGQLLLLAFLYSTRHYIQGAPVSCSGSCVIFFRAWTHSSTQHLSLPLLTTIQCSCSQL